MFGYAYVCEYVKTANLCFRLLQLIVAPIIDCKLGCKLSRENSRCNIKKKSKFPQTFTFFN